MEYMVGFAWNVIGRVTHNDGWNLSKYGERKSEEMVWQNTKTMLLVLYMYLSILQILS